MKLKTYLATYLLFLVVLFSCFAIVSAFMVNSQINMYMERSAAEFQRIAVSLSRDIAILSGISQDLAGDLYALLNNYMEHYAGANVALELYVLPSGYTIQATGVTATFTSYQDGHFIEVAGQLPEPFRAFWLDYSLDITPSMAAMGRIQNILFYVCLGFALLTAAMLYVILARIFKPLGLVSHASRKIAAGHYDERITLHGKNELAAMAQGFNTMADEIQTQMQILKDEADAKQQFVDNIAHELRTPLTSIFGYAEYVQKIASNDGDTIEAMQYIMDEAEHMQNIANSLLTLATLRGYTAEMHSINASDLFDHIKKSLRHQTAQIITETDTETIYGQEDLVRSLLLNLVTNALKACPPEGGVVTLSARVGEGETTLTVTDNGCGISEENLARITEPFYRADKSRNRAMGGVGLGLAICTRIAQAHGTNLVITSVVNTGTTVEITLPSQSPRFYNLATTPQQSCNKAAL
ncbi:MAG: HAMP domain-containing histidine kinase [Defluviitaleaceae bacterium]|nr:HAMP domain-containing histidine kinase [Defluviitaleaceae bacterium]